MQLYQFERIYSQMEKEFGKMRKGEEEEYAMILFPLESNVLKIHRADSNANSRRLKEAIALVLFDIKSRCTKETYDVEKFRNEENGKLEKALKIAFDPFTNENVAQVTGLQMDEAQLREYYKVPVMCLLRIKDSIDTWEKRLGDDGYFLFVEQYMGAQVNGEEMDFTIMLEP